MCIPPGKILGTPLLKIVHSSHQKSSNLVPEPRENLLLQAKSFSSYQSRTDITKCHRGYLLARISSTTSITINVPFVFMARCVMVLRGATSLRGALEGVGPENRDFFGP
jgi:hypothetical protein